jgi:hypothetical protein
VTKKIFVSLTTLAVLLAFALLPKYAQAQTRGPAPSSNVLRFLPASDSIMVIQTRRLLTEALPLVTGTDAAKTAQVDAGLEKFKTRTGIDPRSFERVVLGMRYTYPSPNTTKIETVAIAHGKFDVKALVAAGRAAAGGNYREEKYRGATISIISLNDQIKLAGLWDMKIHELAVCAVDASTLALGNPAGVRRAIDAGRAGTRSNAGLIALATRDASSLIGFGMNVTRALLDNLHVGTDAVAKDVGSIRQVYGSISNTQTDFSLLVVARTGTAAEAKGVSETATGFAQLGAIFLARMPPARKKLAQSGLDNLKITTQANEVEIRTRLAAADLASLIK